MGFFFPEVWFCIPKCEKLLQLIRSTNTRYYVLYVYFGIIALIYILDFSNNIDIYEKNKISIA